MLEMAHIDLYLDSPHQASASYPFSSINASVDVDAEAGCGHFTLASHFSKTPKLASNNGDEMIGLLKLNFQLKMNVRLIHVATGDASLRRTDQLIVIARMDTKDNSVTVIVGEQLGPVSLKLKLRFQPIDGTKQHTGACHLGICHSSFKKARTKRALHYRD